MQANLATLSSHMAFYFNLQILQPCLTGSTSVKCLDSQVRPKMTIARAVPVSFASIMRKFSLVINRKVNKQADGMECDCTMSKSDAAAGKKGCGDDCLNRLLMIECGKLCSLGKNCSNKKFQNIENAPVEVFKTKKKGFGLRAREDIQA